MARLFLILAVLAALLLVVAAAVTLARSLADALGSPTLGSPDRPGREDAMPAPVRTTAYVVLILLLLGLAAGVLGPG